MKKSNFAFIKEDDRWLHRPTFKVVINTILRKVQFFTKSPYIICSKVEFAEDEFGIEYPILLGYGFKRIRHEEV